ncbi:MAG TPA: response regulator transcription factor [Candidatus Galloscillospira excrementavium]|nr:response regulator transcription factor [Candidatus Galloscillospira excrementavium]
MYNKTEREGGSAVVRVAIAEDDTACARQLQEYLDRYAGEKGEQFQVSVFPDGLELVESYRPDYDVLLLDIEMPHLDGMEAARRIRQTDPAVIIIFITNMAKYAIKGYEVGALDFVLKPVSYFAFSVKLSKVISALRARRQVSLMIPDGGGLRKVPAEEIYYIEVADHRLHIHTAQGTFSMLGTLKNMEEELAGEHFALCNKCYLVNLRHVTRLKAGTVTLSGGQELQVSRPRRKEFQTAIMNYYGGGAR